VSGSLLQPSRSRIVISIWNLIYGEGALREKVTSGDRMKAIIYGSEIIFSDRSAVQWKGIGWEPDYSFMLAYARDTEADAFMGDAEAAARRAASDAC
jgi:hypothetical protein